MLDRPVGTILTCRTSTTGSGGRATSPFGLPPRGWLRATLPGYPEQGGCGERQDPEAEEPADQVIGEAHRAAVPLRGGVQQLPDLPQARGAQSVPLRDRSVVGGHGHQQDRA